MYNLTNWFFSENAKNTSRVLPFISNIIVLLEHLSVAGGTGKKKKCVKK